MSNPRDMSKAHPIEHLADAAALGTSEAIESSEARGQGELVESSVIPAEGPVDALRDLGFEVGEPDPDDPLFRPCKLPEGWRKEPSSHSMWSYIIDGDGYRRVGCFYKAAFYDRNAHFHIESVPKTGAQDDSVGHLYGRQEGHEGIGFPNSVVKIMRDGGDVLVIARTLAKGEDGHPYTDPDRADEDSRWAQTGEIREWRIAPDGTVTR